MDDLDALNRELGDLFALLTGELARDRTQRTLVLGPRGMAFGLAENYIAVDDTMPWARDQVLRLWDAGHLRHRREEPGIYSVYELQETLARYLSALP